MARGAGTLLGHRVKDFIEAKEDFVDEMYAWSGVEANNASDKPAKNIRTLGGIRIGHAEIGVQVRGIGL